MFLEKLKLFVGPKVCGELYAQLVVKHEELEIQHATQESRAKLAAKKNEELKKKISDWYYTYHRLKLTFSVAMTEAPTFEHYDTVMASKNQDIERLENLVHQLSFNNSELEQKLEKAKLQEKSSDWCSEGVQALDRYYSPKQISILKNQKVF